MIRLYALGTAVDVDLAGSELDEAEFLRLWSRAVAESSSGVAAGWATSDEGEFATVALNTPTTYESATQQITQALIRARVGELLMLHAGAVAEPTTGRSLAYAAPGGTGKSTLTKLLGQRFGYISDETVGVDPHTLEVFPYQKPITWTEERGTPKREHAVDELALLPVPERPRLARLAVLRRTDGAVASFTQLELLDAIEMLVPETSSLSKLPRPLTLLAEVLGRVGGVTLIEYGEAEDVVEWCAQVLTAVGPFDQPQTAGSGNVEAAGSGDAGVDSAVLGEDVVDFLESDGQSLVLLERQLLRLGPVATAILRLQQASPSVTDLAAALEAEFGTPAEGDLIEAVEEQLKILHEHGVLDPAG